MSILLYFVFIFFGFTRYTYKKTKYGCSKVQMVTKAKFSDHKWGIANDEETSVCNSSNLHDRIQKQNKIKPDRCE